MIIGEENGRKSYLSNIIEVKLIRELIVKTNKKNHKNISNFFETIFNFNECSKFTKLYIFSYKINGDERSDVRN